MRELVGIVMGNLPNVDLLMQEKNRYLVLDAVADMLREKVYETGRIEPSAKSLAMLATLYNVSVDTLVGRPEETDFDDPYKPDNVKESNDFLEANNDRLGGLGEKEKLMLYYFDSLSNNDKERAITVMQAVYRHNQKLNRGGNACY